MAVSWVLLLQAPQWANIGEVCLFRLYAGLGQLSGEYLGCTLFITKGAYPLAH